MQALQRRGGQGTGGSGGRERGWEAESRGEDRREEPAAEHPHWRLLERGVRSEEEQEGEWSAEGGRGEAASALVSHQRSPLISSGQPGACPGGV